MGELSEDCADMSVGAMIVDSFTIAGVSVGVGLGRIHLDRLPVENPEVRGLAPIADRLVIDIWVLGECEEPRFESLLPGDVVADCRVRIPTPRLVKQQSISAVLLKVSPVRVWMESWYREWYAVFVGVFDLLPLVVSLGDISEERERDSSWCRRA